MRHLAFPNDTGLIPPVLRLLVVALCAIWALSHALTSVPAGAVVTTGGHETGQVDDGSTPRSTLVQTVNCLLGNAVASSFQPDLLIRLPSDSQYIGDNLYTLDGTGQTRARAVAAGSTYYHEAQSSNPPGLLDRRHEQSGIQRASGDSLHAYMSRGNLQ